MSDAEPIPPVTPILPPNAKPPADFQGNAAYPVPQPDANEDEVQDHPAMPVADPGSVMEDPIVKGDN